MSSRRARARKDKIEAEKRSSKEAYKPPKQRCGKVCYPTALSASRALNRARVARSKHRGDVDYKTERALYYCEGCRAYHLTSTTRRSRPS